MQAWIGARLSRKFLFFLGAELVTASLLFLALFIGFYRAHLAEERAAASAQVNRLLQVALENAMLKRDLDGLRDIVFYLGQQENIRRVTIISPRREVRFSSKPETIDSLLPEEPGGLSETHTRFLVDEQGREVLRSINPVQNREPCTRCHGAVAEHPVNGILIVDYDAANLRHAATRTALLLIGCGGLVLLVTLGGSWLMLRRSVLRPVERLGRVSGCLAAGDLSARLRPGGQEEEAGGDELAQLGRSFDIMAARLEEDMDVMRRQEAFLQALIDTIPDAIRVIAPNHAIVKANQAYCRMVGRSLPEVLGVACHRSSHGRQEPCPPTLVTCPLAEIAHDPRPLKAVQRIIDGEGGDRPVEVRAAPFDHGDGVVLLIESLRDRTEEIRFSHEQKLSAVGELAAGVAHEIRNPLASVRLALQGTLRQVADGDPLDPAELSAYLRLVDGQVDKCIDVTDRLLRLAANTGGARQLVPVNTVVAETLSLLAWEAQVQGVIIGQALDPGGPRILANDGELRMVVLNLAQNAFHAMPAGGTLTVTTRRTAEGVEMLFDDTGVGIAPEHRPYIFDPFFSARADGQAGTGLGLTICRTLLTRAGGSIAVQSVVGQGTCFILRLPAAEGSLG